jgi:hypothetical protein
VKLRTGENLHDCRIPSWGMRHFRSSPMLPSEDLLLVNGVSGQPIFKKFSSFSYVTQCKFVVITDVSERPIFRKFRPSPMLLSADL